VFPGDVIRTGTRGAHAAEIRSKASGARVVLGPGTAISIPIENAQSTNANVIDFLEGEIEVRPGEGQFYLRKKNLAVTRVTKVGWFSLSQRRTLTEEPAWLKGWRASTSDEWMGSLLAKVDGREVPLAVGYHRVDVEIRDQIARTTVEESFVNGTDETLEGVFSSRFPPTRRSPGSGCGSATP
jgi:hypothetical protein